jgi:hypothetical protein
MARFEAQNAPPPITVMDNGPQMAASRALNIGQSLPSQIGEINITPVQTMQMERWNKSPMAKQIKPYWERKTAESPTFETSCHEASHTLAAILIGMNVTSVSVKPQDVEMRNPNNLFGGRKLKAAGFTNVISTGPKDIQVVAAASVHGLFGKDGTGISSDLAKIKEMDQKQGLTPGSSLQKSIQEADALLETIPTAFKLNFAEILDQIKELKNPQEVMLALEQARFESDIRDDDWVAIIAKVNENSKGLEVSFINCGSFTFVDMPEKSGEKSCVMCNECAGLNGNHSPACSSRNASGNNLKIKWIKEPDMHIPQNQNRAFNEFEEWPGQTLKNESDKKVNHGFVNVIDVKGQTISDGIVYKNTN